MTRWAILTGEYPPQLGGVADYIHLVALSLEAAGDEVTVFAPALKAGRDLENPGICVTRLLDHFGPRGLAVTGQSFRRRPPDLILVQYVPPGCDVPNPLTMQRLFTHRADAKKQSEPF